MGIPSWLDRSVFPQTVLNGIADRGGHIDLNEKTIGNKWEAVMALGSADSLERL